MPIFLNEDQQLFQDSARKFAEREVAPIAVQIDDQDQVPPGLISKFAEQGYFGLYIPEEYGGLGKNLTSSCVVLEEIAKASPSLAGMLSVEMILGPETIELLGNEEQKKRFLIPSAQGKGLLAWSMSEPSGALNVVTHQTRLTPDGEGYRLNGLKLFATQGSAEFVLVMTKTRRDGVDGYGCVIVDMSAEGVGPAPYESKLGWRGTNTGAIAFSDVYIPPENVIGDLLTSVSQMWPANCVSFLAHAVTSLGCAEGMFDRTVEYMKQRDLYNGPMSRLQPMSYWLAEVHAKILACRALVYNTARHYDEGGTDYSLASVAKAYVGDTAFDCCHRLLQMWGGSGMMDSTGINRYFRDARTKQIAEAASEFHYDIVAGAILGQPSMSGIG